MPATPVARAWAAETRLAATGLAKRSLEIWFGDPGRSGAALAESGRQNLRRSVLGRVYAVLEQERPEAANRRWLCDTVRAWAPLEVLFPSPTSLDTGAVSGELGDHLALIVEREYGHLAAGLGSVARAEALLRADAQRLALELEIGASLRPLLGDDPGGEDWLGAYIEMSLAMAEYLHRQVSGLAQRLEEPLAMRYATLISRTQRELRAACWRVPATSSS
jgi:hypothetical protein